MQRLNRSAKDLLIISLSAIFLTLLIWLPHLLAFNNLFNLNFSQGFNTIYRNFDGIEYIIIAKTFYNPNLMARLPQSLPSIYFASHFPGYSLAILLFAPLVGFLKSMILTSLLFTIASIIAFYFLLKDFKLTEKPLLLSLMFLVLPARWLIVHSVGSAEPMFIFFTILCIYFFMQFEIHKKTYLIWSSATFGLLAQLTRPPGLLIFIALVAYIHWKFFINAKLINFKKAFFEHLRYYPYLLIPLGTLAIFYFYKLSLGDFFAYFHSGDNIHLTFPSFQVFNKNQYWVGEIWLEDIVYIFLLGFYGGFLLFKQKLRLMSFFVLTYLAATTMVAHRDISRYALPIFPFLLVAFERVLTSREFKIALLILLPAIYLYTQNFILANTAPIPNVGLFN